MCWPQMVDSIIRRHEPNLHLTEHLEHAFQELALIFVKPGTSGDKRGAQAAQLAMEYLSAPGSRREDLMFARKMMAALMDAPLFVRVMLPRIHERRAWGQACGQEVYEDAVVLARFDFENARHRKDEPGMRRTYTKLQDLHHLLVLASEEPGIHRAIGLGTNLQDIERLLGTHADRLYGRRVERASQLAARLKAHGLHDRELAELEAIPPSRELAVRRFARRHGIPWSTACDYLRNLTPNEGPSRFRTTRYQVEVVFNPVPQSLEVTFEDLERGTRHLVTYTGGVVDASYEVRRYESRHFSLIEPAPDHLIRAFVDTVEQLLPLNCLPTNLSPWFGPLRQEIGQHRPQ
jgi:hypothetical protein